MAVKTVGLLSEIFRNQYPNFSCLLGGKIHSKFYGSTLFEPEEVQSKVHAFGWTDLGLLRYQPVRIQNMMTSFDLSFVAKRQANLKVLPSSQYNNNVESGLVFWH